MRVSCRPIRWDVREATSSEGDRVAGPRRWAPARVIRALQAESGLPEGGTVERDGRLTCLAYRDNGLLRRLDIEPTLTPGHLQWHVGVCDEAVRSTSTALWTHYKAAPGLSLRPGQEPRGNFTGYSWPVSGADLDPQLVRDVARFAQPMLWFLDGRHDLGMMLLHHGTADSGFLRRGEVMGRRWGELAAGIVEAIILGRAIPDPELEDLGFARLDAGLASGRSAGRWAALFQHWSPVDINDLLRLGTYSPAAIRSEFARYFPDRRPGPD
jgi:hypothetical protein